MATKSLAFMTVSLPGRSKDRAILTRYTALVGLELLGFFFVPNTEAWHRVVGGMREWPVA